MAEVRIVSDLRDDCDRDDRGYSGRTFHYQWTFDGPNWIKPTTHEWTRSALHWMTFPSGVELMETQELLDGVVTDMPGDLGPHRAAGTLPRPRGGKSAPGAY
jgi:hypothetical protein